MTTTNFNFDTDCSTAQAPLPKPLGHVWPSFPRHAQSDEFACIITKKCYCLPPSKYCLLCARTPLPQPSGYERRGFPPIALIIDDYPADSPGTDSEEHTFSFPPTAHNHYPADLPQFAPVLDAGSANSPFVDESHAKLSQVSICGSSQSQPSAIGHIDDALRSKALEIMEGWDTCKLWEALQNPEAVKAILSQKVITRKEEKLLLAQLAKQSAS